MQQAKFNGIAMVVSAIISGSLMIWFSYAIMQPVNTFKDDLLTNVGMPIVAIGVLILVIAGLISFRR